MQRSSWLAALAVWLPLAALAAEPAALAGSETESSRSPTVLLETPLSISVISREELIEARPAFDLAEAMPLVPGVFAQSARNGAQDARISIRGYGARAAFGIRGVKILVDGFPTTLADGQSEVDSIDLSFVERVEVLRGPVSSLYGGGGGGSISLFTAAPTDEPRLELRCLVGRYGLRRDYALATGRAGDVGYSLGLADARSAGYRDHARTHQTNLHSRFERELGDGSRLSLLLAGVWAPEAQDPGGLTATEVDRDRRASAPNARRFDAGEKLDQQRIGLAWVKPFSPGDELELRGYWLDREFTSSLPFQSSGRVHIDRSAGGGSLLWRQRRGRASWQSGVDLDLQYDWRRRYDNLNGAYGPRVLDQSETVRAVGIFSELALELGRGFGCVFGGRWDWTEFVVGDRVATPDDGSGRIRFREFSPRVGVHWSRSPLLLAYANLGSAFRVPTTTEFAPGGTQRGFDDTLEPERTLGLELGARGLLGNRLLYDLALFELRIRDALIPFQDASGVQRARNAAEVKRRGLELGLSALLHPWLTLRLAYTWAHYRYSDYDLVNLQSNTVTDLSGNREPNVPEHLLGAELRFEHPEGWFASASLRYFTDIEVDDANDAESRGATISDLRVGFRMRRGALELEPFVAVSNWTGATYDATLRPNATFGRYYEPAPGAEWSAGITLRY